MQGSVAVALSCAPIQSHSACCTRAGPRDGWMKSAADALLRFLNQATFGLSVLILRASFQKVDAALVSWSLASS